MSVKGGEPRRLTYHSTPESPFAFSPDGQSIVFGAARMDTQKIARSQPPTYPSSIGSGGGRPSHASAHDTG